MVGWRLIWIELKMHKNHRVKLEASTASTLTVHSIHYTTSLYLRLKCKTLYRHTALYFLCSFVTESLWFKLHLLTFPCWPSPNG